MGPDVKSRTKILRDVENLKPKRLKNGDLSQISLQSAVSSSRSVSCRRNFTQQLPKTASLLQNLQKQ